MADPNPTISSQSATSTNLNIWVTTGPLALSVAGVVIMGINVLTLVALVVVGTFLYKHKRHHKQPTRLSLDTINLNVQKFLPVCILLLIATFL